jgi:hypothetical protein
VPAVHQPFQALTCSMSSSGATIGKHESTQSALVPVPTTPFTTADPHLQHVLLWCHLATVSREHSGHTIHTLHRQHTCSKRKPRGSRQHSRVNTFGRNSWTTTQCASRTAAHIHMRRCRARMEQVRRLCYEVADTCQQLNLQHRTPGSEILPISVSGCFITSCALPSAYTTWLSFVAKLMVSLQPGAQPAKQHDSKSMVPP